MSLAELRAFDAVARHESFVRAANELGRSQPTLTMQVARLEKDYEAELIIRSRGRIKGLTPLGKTLLEVTRTMFALERDAYSILRDAGQLSAGEVYLNATSPAILIRLTQAFNALYPNISCHMKFGNSEEVLKSVLNCESDLGILGGSVLHDDCIAIPVAKPEIVLVGARDLLKERPNELSREEFAKETLLIREPGSETRDLLLDKISKHGFHPRRTVEIGRRSGAIAAAMAGMGLAAVSENELEPNEQLSIVRLKGVRVFGVNHAVCLKSRSHTKLIQALLKCFEV